ncbi:hypothetical protein AB0J20_28335 [Micromonospora costi]|uniref:hypothetical protein n=1 Tax=Micromonospora costi TaxID=1530042 RepID=UPI0034118C49
MAAGAAAAVLGLSTSLVAATPAQAANCQGGQIVGLYANWPNSAYAWLSVCAGTFTVNASGDLFESNNWSGWFKVGSRKTLFCDNESLWVTGTPGQNAVVSTVYVSVTRMPGC